MKREGIRYAALDILFSSVVYILFMDKLTLWAVNNETIRRYFPSTTYPGGAHWAVPLPIHAAAFVVLILYIKLLAEAELKDYYLSGPPKLRWILVGLLSVVFYTTTVQLILPGKWIVQIGEPPLSSVLAAVRKSVITYLTNAQYFPVLLMGGVFYGALRRRMSLKSALFAVGGIIAVLSYNGITSAADVTYMLFCGIQGAAFGLIAEYTGSVWSALLMDFPFVILMEHQVINLFQGYAHWSPMDAGVLLIHQPNNPDRLLNELMIGTSAYDHACTVPMAIFYLLVIAYLFAKIRKRSGSPE